MTQLTWFRLYHEARNDAKLRTLTDAQFRVWFNLLCLAAEQKEERGTIRDYPDELLAIEVSGGDVDLLRATLDRLTALRIVTRDEQAIIFANFKRRQYDKESDYPEHVRERVIRYRAKKQEEPPEPPVTPSATAKRDVTPRHAAKRIDTDTDTEKSRSDPNSDLNGKSDPTPLRGAHATARVDALFDALFAEFYEPGTILTDAARGPLNRALKDIRTHGGTPEQVPAYGAEYRARMPGVAYTPNALAKHWPTLGQKGSRPNGTPVERPAATAEEVAAKEAREAERTADSRRWATELVRKLAGGDAAS